MKKNCLSRLLQICAIPAILALSACGTLNPYRPSFVEMARQASINPSDHYKTVGLDGKTNPEADTDTEKAIGPTRRQVESDKYARLQFSDQLALNYATEMVNILRPKFNKARYLREASSTAQVGMAAVAGAAGPFQLDNITLAILGLGSASIPELQRIFNAKERAENYQVAANMIEDGIIEYLSYNQNPSPDILTQNGVSLVHRANAAIHIVEQSLAGRLPTVVQMEQATERMSEDGSKQTAAGTSPSNSIPANGAAPIRKVEPIVIEKTVKLSEGLQPKEIAIITKTTGLILRSMTLEEAQAALSTLTGDPIPDPNAKTILVSMNTDTQITDKRALAIQAAVQAAKK